MFHFLGFIFIIIIAVLFIGLALIGSFLRGIFGAGNRRTGQKGYHTTTYNSSNDSQQSNHSYQESETPHNNGHPKRRKKLFSKDEGEYVDFEEVKDE